MKYIKYVIIKKTLKKSMKGGTMEEPGLLKK